MAVDKFSSAAGPNTGLIKVVPTSVTVGSGSSSVDVNGNITFSGASSISIIGCFTSTYDNYRIVVDPGGTSASVSSVNFDLLNNTTPAGTGWYVLEVYNVNTSGPTRVWYSNSANNPEPFYAGDYTSSGTMDIFKPFLVSRTNFISDTVAIATNNTASNSCSGAQFSVGSWNGFRLTATSGTFTGTLRIYGYNQ